MQINLTKLEATAQGPARWLQTSQDLFE